MLWILALYLFVAIATMVARLDSRGPARSALAGLLWPGILLSGGLRQMFLLAVLVVMISGVSVGQEIGQFSPAIPDSVLECKVYQEITMETMMEAEITIMEDSLHYNAWGFLLSGLRETSNPLFVEKVELAWKLQACADWASIFAVWWYADRGDYRTAWKWNERNGSLALNVDDRRHYNVRAGRLCERMGKTGEAIQRYEAAIQHVSDKFAIERLVDLRGAPKDWALLESKYPLDYMKKRGD